MGGLRRLSFDDSAHPWHVYVSGVPVKMQGSLALLDSWERLRKFGFNDPAYDKDDHPATINWIAHDFSGRVAWRDFTDVRFGFGKPGVFTLDLGKLPRGHYTLYCRIMQGVKFVAQPWPTMITVVDPPTPPAKGVHSKFAHSWYYVLQGSPEETERRVRLLTLAKVRLSVGSVFKWWMEGDPVKWAALPPAKRTLPRAPRIETLEKAKKLGLEFTGQLGAYYQPARNSKNPNLKRLPPDHVIVNQYWDAGPIDGEKFAKLVDTVVYETVKRYKDHFRYWRLDNEMNLLGWTPAEYVLLHRLTYRAMKRADPNAKLWSGSISGLSSSYVEDLLRLGLDRYIDLYDFHNYIWPGFRPAYRTMGGFETKVLGIFKKYNVKLPLAIGEFGCYQSIFPDGARTQAPPFDARSGTGGAGK